MRTLNFGSGGAVPLSGKVHVTRYGMTEGEAVQRHPNAKRVPGSMEVRVVPETRAETAMQMPGTTMRSGLRPHTEWWRQPYPWPPRESAVHGN